MPREGDSLLLCFVSDGKVSLSRQEGIDLYKISAILFDLSHGKAAFGFRGSRDRSWPKWFWSIHYWAGDDHSRPQELSLLDCISQLKKFRGAEHLPDARDAVSDDEREIV